MSTDAPDDANTAPTPAIKPETTIVGPDDICTAPQRLPATLRRSLACRSNGRLARGKTSSEGRAVVRCNALRHGVFSNIIPAWVLPGINNREDFSVIVAGLKLDYRPVTQTEVLLVESLAGEFLTLRRLYELRNALLFHQPHSFQANAASLAAKLAQCQHRSATEWRDALIMLKTLVEALRRGSPPEIPEARLPALVADIWKEVAGADEAGSSTAEGRAQPDLGSNSSLPNTLSREHPATAEMDAAEDLQKVRDNPSPSCEVPPGLMKYGVACKADAEAILCGERDLPQDAAPVWIDLITRFITKATTALTAARECEVLVNSMKDEGESLAFAHLTDVGLLGQYTTVVQRNIERQTRLLREKCGLADEQFTNVYTEPCSQEIGGASA